MFSRGNRKLPSTTVIFNLPAMRTCPNSTDECRRYCYARKAERIYPQVLPFRENNYQFTKQRDFVSKAVKWLTKTNNWDTVRIHESGDFYIQSYFDKWVKIANTFSDKKFYAYTKVIDLNLSSKPKNMVILLSDDKKEISLTALRKKGFDGRARVEDKEYKKKGKEFICTGVCGVCTYCYNQEGMKQVVFHKH